MFGRIGSTEVIVVLLIILLLFGGKKLPELAKGLGKALSEFKEGFGGEEKKEEEKKE